MVPHCATATGLLSTTGPEIARVLLHMANLFPADPEAVLDTLEVESEQQLRRRIRTGSYRPVFDRTALLERARVADPVPQVYRALVAHYDQWVTRNGPSRGGVMATYTSAGSRASALF